ncbi:class B sortase [Paenibacillus sp. SSG-1]|uniref:class B sortase n=1 Tax=Paenibacillus sp. SSG-1 TaxID=1443669 RepID=UPI001C52742F|nr:class B sortase [Paenibacillus sp. SSG-1]
MNHLFTGEQNRLGSLFVDYRVAGDFSDRNTIIYGHNMKDGSMFSSLAQYRNPAYYETHSYLSLYLPNKEYIIEIFAGIIADGDMEFVRYEFDDDDFLAYIDELRAASTFGSEVAVTGEDRIVSLVTCTYEFDNARYALFGKLVEG